MRYSAKALWGPDANMSPNSILRGFCMSSTYPSARLCQRCGRVLTPSEVYCNTCGQYNSPAPAGGSTAGTPPPGVSWGGPLPQTNYGGGQTPGEQWEHIPSPTAPNNP